VSELASCQHDGVQQLLDLRVENLGVREHLADKVYWPLNEQHVALFRPLDDMAALTTCVVVAT
jgi:hypothetical protein